LYCCTPYRFNVPGLTRDIHIQRDFAQSFPTLFLAMNASPALASSSTRAPANPVPTKHSKHEHQKTQIYLPSPCQQTTVTPVCPDSACPIRPIPPSISKCSNPSLRALSPYWPPRTSTPHAAWGPGGKLAPRRKMGITKWWASSCSMCLFFRHRCWQPQPYDTTHSSLAAAVSTRQKESCTRLST